MGAEGFILKIDERLVGNLQKADEAIENLDKHTTEAYNNMKSAFDKINGLNLDQFIATINSAKDKLSGMGDLKLNLSATGNVGKININGLDLAADKAFTVSNALQRLVETLNGLNAAGGKEFLGGLNSTAKEVLKDMNREAKKLEKTFDKMDISLQRYNESAGKVSQKINELWEAQRKINEEIKASARNNQSMILNPSVKPTTLNELKSYANQIKWTMNNLDPKSEEWRKLNNIYKQTNAEIQNINNSMREMKKQHTSLMDISGQLARKLALIFSISQIQGYMSKLVEVRAEFELNQRALQAMLQNKQMANEIWNKTVELAIQSPFRVKELVSYTKQLAAYRIEADKLYETNKMLADISAGLGVDMQRLILAFGQVRSAAYLRGTEVRQFTEAGIPILEQLSKYLTELEGEAVSLGEVFDRISKRMITFADVEEIFKRMTSEGGTFYRMQEIQAETLKGQISNLKDSFDVMFDAIGKANEGSIKNFLNSIRFLTEHWEMFVPVLKAVVAMIAAMGIKALVTNKRLLALAFSLDVITNSATKQLTIMQVLATSWKALTSSIGSSIKGLASFAKANPWLVAITAVLGVLIKIRSVLKEHKEAINDITKEYDDMRKSVSGISVNFGLALNKGSFEEQKKQLSQLVSVAEKDYDIQINIDWEQITPQNITDKFEEIRNQILDINTFSENFAINMQKASEWKPTGDIFSDLNKVGVVASENFRNLKNDAISVADALQEAKKNGQELTDAQEKAFEKLAIPQKINESELDYVERLKEGYDLLLGKYRQIQTSFFEARGTGYAKPLKNQLKEEEESLKRIGINAEEVKKTFSDWNISIYKAKEEFNSFIKSINIDENLSEEQRTAMVKFAIDKFASQNNWNDFTKNYLYKWAEEPLNVKINFVEDPDDPKELEGWQKTYKDLFGGLSTFYKSLSQETNQTEVIDNLKNQYKETNDLLERVKAAGKGAYPDKSVDELTKKMIELNKQAKWFGINLEESGKDSASEMNSRINLLKEMNKRYEELAKTFDSVTAKEKVMTSFAKSFEEIFKGMGISIEDIDVTSMESMVNSLKKLEPIASKEGKNAYNALMKEIGEFEVQIGLNVKKDADKKLKDEVDKLFDQYNLSVELKKLKIPDDLAKSLFDVDMLNLDELKAKLDELRPKFTGTDMEDEYQKYLNKIADLQNKETEQQAKDFYNFVKKNLDEIEAQLQARGMNIAIADKLFSEGKITSEQYMSFIKNIINKTNDEISKIRFDKFKESEIYIKAMGELAGYTHDELKKIADVLKNEIAENAKNMGADELKAYYEALKRVNEELKKFGTPINENSISKIIEYKKLEQQLNEERKKSVEYEQRLEKLKERLIELEKQLTEAKKEGNQARIDEIQGTIKETNDAISNVQNLQKNSAASMSAISNSMGQLAAGASKALFMVDAIITAVYQTIKSAVEIFESAKELADSFGKDTETGDWGKASAAFEAINDFNENVMEGWERAKSGDVAGSLASIAKTWLGLITNINKAIDRNKNDIIAEQEKRIKSLTKAYSKLEKAIDEALDINDYRQVNEEILKNMELRIAANEMALEAEKSKKNPDEEVIEGYEEAIDEAKEKLQELKDEYIEGLGGVGGTDAVKNKTEDFLDAWISSFKETGSGLEGLNEKFDDFFDNTIKKQMALRGANKFLQGFFEEYDKLIEEGSKGGTEVMAKNMEKIKALWEGISPELDKFLENLYKALGGITGGGGGELSELSKGISSASEESIEILTAYANSIRFINQDSNEKLGMLLNNFANGNEISNDMLAELRTQTRWIRDIYNLINGLTASYSGGGSGIKVVM
ncbi:MAG: tape measure protein [Agathobacter sp.]